MTKLYLSLSLFHDFEQTGMGYYLGSLHFLSMKVDSRSGEILKHSQECSRNAYLQPYTRALDDNP